MDQGAEEGVLCPSDLILCWFSENIHHTVLYVFNVVTLPPSSSFCQMVLPLVTVMLFLAEAEQASCCCCWYLRSFLFLVQFVFSVGIFSL